MKTPGRVDRNQVEVVAALRQAGCSVQHLFLLGRGVPDLLIGYQGQNWLVEIKDGDKAPNKRQLTEDELHWQNIGVVKLWLLKA